MRQHPWRPPVPGVVAVVVVVVVVLSSTAPVAVGRKYEGWNPRPAEPYPRSAVDLQTPSSSGQAVVADNVLYHLNNRATRPSRKRYLKGSSNVFGVVRLQERFPRLTPEQRRFAVHPGYMSYYNSEYEHIEDELDFKEAALARKLKAEKQRNPDEDSIQDRSPEWAANDPLLVFHGEDDDDDDSALGPEFVTLDRDELAPRSPKKSLNGVVRSNTNNATLMKDEESESNVYYTTTVAVSSAALAFFVLGSALWYNRAKLNAKAAEDVEYPAYGLAAGSAKEDDDTSPILGGDRKLAQNAQMYHYQHQKRQMISFDRHQSQRGDVRPSRLGSDDDDSDDGGDSITVFECPGMAREGGLEVRNPSFVLQESPTK